MFITKKIKSILLSLLLLLQFFTNAATVRTSPSSGSANWASISWTSSGSGTPITYVIQSGFTANINANTTLANGDSILVYGTISFSNARDLTIPGATAFVQVFTGGTVTGGNTNSNLIVGATTNSGTYNIIGPAYTSNTTQFTSGNALPVTWGYVKGTKEVRHNIIQWSTASEINNSHFDIERAGADGRFSKIGTVLGNGTSFQIHEYQFEDFNPLSGTNIYRIRQTDFDGKSEFSSLIVLENEILNQIKVFPTVIHSIHQNIQITHLSADDHVIVIDPLGKVIESELQKIENGNSRLTIKNSEISKGIYNIIIQNSFEQSNFKIVIQ